MRNLMLKISRAIFGWPPSPATTAQKQALVTRIGRETGAKILVETGTFCGEMIDAQMENFKKIISIELNAELHQAARIKYAQTAHVELLQGDSGLKIQEVTAGLQQAAMFWLDAHYSRGFTSRGAEETPIMKELACIAARKEPGDVILIDDARHFGLKSGYPKLKIVREFATKHWPKHIFSVETDVICIIPSR